MNLVDQYGAECVIVERAERFPRETGLQLDAGNNIEIIL